MGDFGKESHDISWGTGGGEGRDKLSPNEYRGVTYENWLL